MTITVSKTSIKNYLKPKPLWNVIAIFYTIASYFGGITFILVTNVFLNVLGVILLTHSLVISAYLLHEFMHGTIFKSHKLNQVASFVMLWLNGACYARFNDLAKEHINHHIDRVDYYGFDLVDFLKRLPNFLRNIILVLEWLYFPAIFYLLAWRAIAAPFFLAQRQDERKRITVIFCLRGSLFMLLGFISVKALLLYWFGHIGMVLVLRLLDAFQHTYETFPLGCSSPKRNRVYERANTFTTVISKRYWWLNLLLLNFCYHNAHHEVMRCPWHNLHELNRKISTEHQVHSMNLKQMLVSYHRFRLKRIFQGQGQAINELGEFDLAVFYGAIGVSMLIKY